jgi:hypothetical protein
MFFEIMFVRSRNNILSLAEPAVSQSGSGPSGVNRPGCGYLAISTFNPEADTETDDWRGRDRPKRFIEFGRVRPDRIKWLFGGATAC